MDEDSIFHRNLVVRPRDYSHCGTSRRILRSYNKYALSRVGPNATLPQTSITNATLPSCFSAVSAELATRLHYNYTYDGLGNRTTLVTTKPPVVSTHCWSSDIHGGNFTAELDSKILYLHDNRISLGVLFDVRTLVDRVSDFHGSGSAASAASRSDNAILPIDADVHFPPIWTASPEPGSHSLIGIFPFWKRDTSDQREEPPPSLSWAMTKVDSKTRGKLLSIMVCNIRAYWNSGEIQLVETLRSSEVQTSALDVSELLHARPITLDVANIDTIWSPEFSRDLYDIVSLPDMALSEFFAMAISAIPLPNPILKIQMPPDYDEHNSTSLRYTTVLYGYGYGSRSTSVQLAMAVMLTYCVLTLSYIIYILITGSTSTAWNSAIELVTLALQSRKPDHLGNIGVGLDSVQTFKEGVGIRVNQDNELELVFAHDRDIDKKGLRKIERNKEY
jgi:hypothetical protein